MIGHTWAVDLLSGHVAHGQERHAYLFTGPQGIGRRTLALRFAQALNCLQSPAPGEPCRRCSSCTRFEAMLHPDLSVVQAEHEGEVLRIDQVRELQHSLALAPYESRYRIALLLRFEEAHASAANAMLKTLEEPPAQVVIILTANGLETLLPTIVSRCEVLRLRPLSYAETSLGLQRIRGLPSDTAEKLAHISSGRPGYALRLYSQPELLEQRSSSIDDLFDGLASSRRDRFALAISRVNNKDELRHELQIWLTIWRDVLILASGLPGELTNLDYSGQLESLARRIGVEAARFYVSSVEETINRIDHNINLRLAFEDLLLLFPRI